MTRGTTFVGAIRLAALLLGACSLPALAMAQEDDVDGPETASKAVVQPIPGTSSSYALNTALARLAQDPRNPVALVDAGTAALQLGDTDAALGFFRRADEVGPGSGPASGKLKAQIASAYLKSENPYDAIRYFDEAEKAGADLPAIAGDRGLAYDLVGDNATAQRWYQVALSRGANDEVTRRYALSLAISGDKHNADAMLSPLIQKQDRAAWRVRTFVMAITGKPDEAVSIAYATMPQDLASGISPYLRYMPRLTAAQQAAAANFGRFPRAADIGRDDARAAQYASASPRPHRADAGLIPVGEPLGRNARDARADDKVSREKRRRPGQLDPQQGGSADVRLARADTVAAPPPAFAAQPVPTSQPPKPAALGPIVQPVRQPPPTPAPKSVQVAVATPAPKPVQAAPAPALKPVPAAAPAPIKPPAPVAIQPAAIQPVQQAAVSLPAPAPASTGAFDLARLGGSSTVQAAPVAPAPVATLAPVTPAPVAAAPVATPAPAPKPVPALVAAPKPPAGPVDFRSAFGDFRPPADEQSRRVAAVDITRIRPARPKPPEPVAESDAKDPKAKDKGKASARGERPDGPSASRTADRATAATPAKGSKAATPSHPSRIWVQVSTGANRDMMDTDWRRIVRQAPDAFRGKRAYVTPWRSNFRLLTGPFESDAAAQAFLNQLARAKVGGFQWTSTAGQVVDTLAVK